MPVHLRMCEKIWIVSSVSLQKFFENSRQAADRAQSFAVEGNEMQAIAFYLPQFHSIVENDVVYGKGFTEWDNVRSAKPLFRGHYQPKIPHKTFGYYNLLDEKFLVFQHEIAYENGIEGFCYYYYNLAGKRLLEKPVDIINKNTSIKNRFCLCWDHHSWYNNKNNHKNIFIEQVYSRQNALNLFDDLRQYFENERYIKIDGRPLLCIWAPEKNPLIIEYADILHEQAQKCGYPGIWLAGVAAFADCHPNLLGLDSMIEYAPNWNREAMLSGSEDSPRIYSYPETLRIMVSKKITNYIYNRCVFPGWDNTPRRGPGGIVFVDSSVDIYKACLEFIIQYTQMCLPPTMQYVFLNAWNEWGEGCILEPDERNGFTYLKATRDVIRKYA